jgi:hypothetical protein
MRFGGQEITVTPNRKKPRFLQRFEMHRISYRGGNSASISLFDGTWETIEPLLVKQGMSEFSLQYGYSGGLQSPVYTMSMQAYSRSYAVDGKSFAIQAVSSGLEGDTRKKSYTWEDKDIHEIVIEICNKHGWTPDVDETEEILENSGLEDTKFKKRSFHQQSMTDMQFIIDELAPLATRLTDKASDYRVVFDDSENILHFHPLRPEEAKGDLRVFNYLRDPLSEVLSFDPVVKGALKLQLGSAISTAPFIHHQTGEIGIVQLNDKETPEKVLIGGKWTYLEEIEEDDDSSSVVDSRIARDGNVAKILARDRYMEQFIATFGAELSILGDPRMKVHQFIKVMVRRPDGSLEDTSGLYVIGDITDVIDHSQGFRTTLKLQRSGYTPEKGVVPATKVGVGTASVVLQ